jgi:hypothetical protein
VSALSTAWVVARSERRAQVSQRKAAPNSATSSSTIYSHAEKNGLKPALLKVGGRVYIDRAEFNKWLDGQRMAPKPMRPAA